jgi:two-component sensor histidine kinase
MKIKCSTQCDELDTTQDFLVAELQHRIRNLLTLVQYLIAHTHSGTVAEYRGALNARISNLAEAYEFIARSNGDPVSLVELLEGTLKPYATVSQDRIRATGPDIDLEPRLGLSLHLIFHELATNACKHGALASSTGRVAIDWSVDSDASNQKLIIQWSESGGPGAHEPQHKGFGLNLVTKILADADVELRFERSGLICRISFCVCKFCGEPPRLRTSLGSFASACDLGED